MSAYTENVKETR